MSYRLIIFAIIAISLYFMTLFINLSCSLLNKQRIKNIKNLSDYKTITVSYILFCQKVNKLVIV